MSYSTEPRMMQIVKLYSPSRLDLGAYVTVVGGHQDTVRDTLMCDFDDYVNSFGSPDGERGNELLALDDCEIECLEQIISTSTGEDVAWKWIRQIRDCGFVCETDLGEPVDNEVTVEFGVYRIYSPSRPDLPFQIGTFNMANVSFHGTIDDTLDAILDVKEAIYEDHPESVGPLDELFEIGDIDIELLETFECLESEVGATIAEYTSIHQAHFDDEREQARNDALHRYMTPEELAIALGMIEELEITWTAAA